MSKDKISDYSSTANSNTDIAAINIDEGCAPSGINNAIRALMAQLKNWQSGAQDVYITPAGSASAPAVTTNGDTNTGVYFPAADKIALATGGTQAVIVDASQNVGIGTSSPGSRLELSKSANAAPTELLRLSNTGSGDLTQAQITFYAAGTNYAVITGGYNAAPSLISNVASSGYHSWQVATAEKMRIDSSGNLLVGTTSAGGTNSNSCLLIPSGGFFAGQHANGTSSGTLYSVFNYNGSAIGSISQNGTTGVLYNLTSDYRLKNDQQPLTGAKEFVMALQPKKWQWWDGSGEGVGFIAHEFMEVAKYSGNGEKDAVDADGNPVYQSIQPSSSEVMANLVSLLQEQQAIITQLQADVAALKGQA